MMVFGCRESTGAYGRSQVLLAAAVRGSNAVVEISWVMKF